MKYLVIDLEMCKVPKGKRSMEYKYSQETIQIGAVLLDSDFKQIGALSQYVRPEYGVLDDFITELTGIRECNIRNAPSLQEALEHMIDWIGDWDYEVYAWSESDRYQLLHEIKAKHINSDRIAGFMEEEWWVDYQAEFSSMFGFSRKISLEEALTRAEIQMMGRQHDGLADAINTGALIAKLELNPDFEIVDYGVENVKKPLSCTLGELWPQLKFA